MKINLNLGGLALLTILFIGCENKKITITQSRPLSSIELKGKAVYLSNCIACHNPDPNKPGSIGPDVASSSLELITARITNDASITPS
jgi:mono/diheme cytochrome c family protein